MQVISVPTNFKVVHSKQNYIIKYWNEERAIKTKKREGGRSFKIEFATWFIKLFHRLLFLHWNYQEIKINSKLDRQEEKCTDWYMVDRQSTTN